MANTVKGKGRARPRSKRTDRARATFLATLEETCNVSASARAAGLGRRTVYEWREDDPTFAADWDEAEEIAADKLEQVARERAIDGSDRMLEILLKAHRPEKFVERQHLKVEAIDPVEVLKAANNRVRNGR